VASHAARPRGTLGPRERCRSRSAPGRLPPGPTVTLPERSVLLGPPPAHVIAPPARERASAPAPADARKGRPPRARIDLGQTPASPWRSRRHRRPDQRTWCSSRASVNIALLGTAGCGRGAAVARPASGVGRCSGSSAASVRVPLRPGHARECWARAIDLLFIAASGLVIESVLGSGPMTRLTRIGERP
jgi:hypothetical protein